MRLAAETRGAAAAACKILDVDPTRVTALGFALEASGAVRVTVELLVDELTLGRLLEALALPGDG